MRGKWLWTAALIFMLFLDSPRCLVSYGAPAGEEAVQVSAKDEIARYDFTSIDRFLSRYRSGGSGEMTFAGLMELLIGGQWEKAAEQVLGMLKDGLLSEMETGAVLMGQIMMLGIVGAFFSNFSGVFPGGQISEAAFYVTYLLMFTFLATGFLTGVQVAGELLEGILHFMRALVPSYYLAVAAAGGSLTSMALYPFTLGVIAVLEWVFPALLLPLLRVDILFVMAGHIMKENVFSKMTEMLTGLIKWSMKTMLGAVLGFQLIQGMVLPFADSMKATAFSRMAGMIPGIGQGAASVSQILLGSGVLIKNAMGAAAVVVLLTIAAVPLIKLLFLAFLYQGAAALMQPVCDKRLVSCVYEVGNGHKLLLKMSMTALLMFILSIAIVCMGTNTSYFSG